MRGSRSDEHQGARHARGAAERPTERPVDAPASRGPTGRRRARIDRTRERARILAAAEQLLGVRSLSALTVKEIASQAAVSVGYIYKLFEGKEDILAELLRKKLGELRTMLEEVAGQPADWERRVERTVLAVSEWAERTPAYRADVAFHYKAFARTHPGVAADFAAFLEFYKNFANSIFADPLEKGLLREERPGDVSRSFRALLAGFMEESLMRFEKDRALAENAELIVRIVKRAFAPDGGTHRHDTLQTRR